MGGVLLIAETIQLASHTLAKGDYSKYPDLDWAEGVGGSIMAFAKALQIQQGLKMMSIFSGGGVNLNDFIVDIADAMLTAGKKLSSKPEYWQKGSYPGLEWAEGVGGSIMAFAKALQMQQDAAGIMGFFGGGNVDLESFILNISDAILSAGRKFSTDGKGLWLEGTYPGKDWAEGVGGSILAFAQAMKALDDAGVDIDADDLNDNDGAVAIMLGLSAGIIEVGKYFSENGKSEYWNLDKVPYQN